VLEHIADPVGFLQAVRSSLPDAGAVAYFEVPNARFVMEESVWDVIYEHCSYFTSASLAGLFVRCGFEILRLQESYGGQFLSLDVRFVSGKRAVRDADGSRSGSIDAAFSLGDAIRERVASWGERLREFDAQGLRVVVWGAGAKAVTFLNLVEGASVVGVVVDINPNKQDKYIAGTGQRIVSPAFLAEFEPEIVILMNAMYDAEVRRMLAKNGVEASVIQA
jgi:hypothetical protein